MNTRSPPPFPGYLTPLLARVLPRLSLWKVYKSCFGISEDDVDEHAKFVEKYIAAWVFTIFIELVVVSWTYGSRGSPWILAAIYPSMRVIDIFQSYFTRYLLHVEMGARGAPASGSRVIVLALLGYLELIFCFALLYVTLYRAELGALGSSNLPNPGLLRDAVYFSAVTQLTIGFGDFSPIGGARILAVLQGLLGLTLTVFIFGQFSSFLRPRDPGSSPS